eukprot:CAMPEP_0115067286 /NCGR_PEP_ID=MMETSP0227-20121206/11303_1 /TAXON_ID=89957 /ORGANISM="Polarella glacialis, Strain CCMP 1383" /LENGTH=1223 /DNA_ID=CAMNT_0002453331 /DNA_START=90 /DNA_END=3761 /DNA_ORIENTATION=-
MSLPATIDDDLEDKLAHEKKDGDPHRPQPLQQRSGSQGECPDYTARVWEHGSHSWQQIHCFSAGLEVDLNSSSLTGSSSGASTAKVRLPSTSLRALLQLQDSLDATTILLDIAEMSSVNFSELFTSMLSSLGTALHGTACQEAQLLLDDHPYLKQYPCHGSGDHVGEAVDIFLCCLKSLEPSHAPSLLLTRLAIGENDKSYHSGHGALRFATVIVCGRASSGKAPSLGQELCRALATTFMNEEFVAQARSVPKDHPELIVQALEHYLATLTIVPTVHMAKAIMTDTEREQATGDYLLSDSLVKVMQRRITGGLSGAGKVATVDFEAPRRKVIGSSAGQAEAVPACANYFVEVDRFSGFETGWRPERRLRQGLVLDVASGEERPHLPHVSVKGLQEVKRLVSQESVAIDVAAGTAGAAIKAVVCQLSISGLPASAASEVTQALQDRADQGVKCQHYAKARKDGQCTDTMEEDCAGLVDPVNDDESCLVLTVLGAQVPADSAIFAAFVRLMEPLAGNFASGPPVKFLVVLVGPKNLAKQLAMVGDSLAALAVDEDLMLNLANARDVSAFISAFDNRLNDLVLLPHAHVHNVSPRTWNASEVPVKQSKSREGEEYKLQRVTQSDAHDSAGFNYQLEPTVADTNLSWTVSLMQKYAMPLVAGVLTAMTWINADETSYLQVTRGAIGVGKVFGHTVDLHFLVNDIFMCFFFGLAIKEVTEALLPGGSLYPLRRATNPLMATLGGVVGPILVYIMMIYLLDAANAFDGYTCMTTAATGGAHRRLSPKADPIPCEFEDYIQGWGVPTATDISLAWVCALIIFGAGHCAINFLLLLAIVDDALGMAIIAIFYPNPVHPVEPVWLLLVVAAIAIAFLLRKANVQYWSPYVFLAGPVAWLGLILAQVHPALALAFVVPLMPSNHAHHIHKKTGSVSFAKRKAEWLLALEGAPLHAFEHHMKLVVDFGMFFFGLANAGVKFESVGGITLAVAVALVVGKTIGIVAFALVAECLGAKLPPGLTKVDLVALASLGGIGLTVALFVSNEAFVDPQLQGQSKMGAVFSVVSAGIAWLVKIVGDKCFNPASDACIPEAPVDAEEGVQEKSDILNFEKENEDTFMEDGWLDDLAMHDIIQVLWVQRKYEKRGVKMPLDKAAKSIFARQVTPSSRIPSKSRSMTPMSVGPDLKNAWASPPSPGSRIPSKMLVPPRDDLRLTAEETDSVEVSALKFGRKVSV